MAYEEYPKWAGGILYSDANELGQAIAAGNVSSVPVEPSPGDPVPPDPSPTIQVIDAGE